MMPAVPSDHESYTFHPSIWWIVIESWQHVTVIAAAMGCAWFISPIVMRLDLGAPDFRSPALVIGGLACALRVAWEALVWIATTYVIRGDAIERTSGVLRRHSERIRTADIRSIRVERGVLQRFFGLSTIGAATAGTGGLDVVIFHVRRDDPRLNVLLHAQRSKEDAA